MKIATMAIAMTFLLSGTWAFAQGTASGPTSLSGTGPSNIGGQRPSDLGNGAAYRTHHRHAMNANASVGAAPVAGTVGMSSGDRGTYMRNLHDSGYDPKNNFNANGVLKTQ